MDSRTAPRRSAKYSRGPKSKKKRGFFRRFWWFFVLVPVVGFLAVAGALFFVYINLDIPDAPPPIESSHLRDRNGKLITTFHSEVDRTVIPLESMPPALRNAVIAAEDKDFYEHGGISPIAIARAAIADIMNRSIEQGGSTITQQYVKNVYTGGERTFRRKIEEAMLAVKLERELSKDEILEKYLNTIYFGQGAYGVEAAARTYWDEPARDLTLIQSATLAGVIAAPSRFDPVDHRIEAKIRRNYVLDRMAEDGYIDPETAARLKERKVTVSRRSFADYPGAYFAEVVRRNLVNDPNYGSEAVLGGGLNIKSTLDLEVQQAAEDIVYRQHLNAKGDPQAALVAIDPKNGDIIAMVGGDDFTESQFNLATQAERQAGSAFKTFTLAAAMQQGYSLSSTWNGPSSIVIRDPECADPSGAPWEVGNADPSEAGTFTLEAAAAHSVNTVFAQLVTEVGPENVAKTAKAMGIHSKFDKPVPCSITLGSQGVTPLDMTAAYATLAAGGDYHAPLAIESIKGPGGVRKFKSAAQEGKGIQPNDAKLVSWALKDVVTEGTGVAAAIPGVAIAGKTGTAQDYKDAWFCGYTSELSTCVWMGYAKRPKPMYNVEGVPTVYGGTIPAEIWQDFMLDYMRIRKLDPDDFEDFPRPDFSRNQKGYTPPAPEPTTPPAEEPSPKPKPDEEPGEEPTDGPSPPEPTP
ncbi:MAG: PBP1A family penicillin-binding protein [Actinomycetota bacterium]